MFCRHLYADQPSDMIIEPGLTQRLIISRSISLVLFSTELSMSELSGLSEHTVSVWRCTLNKFIAEYLMLNPVILGGFGIIVSLIIRKKINSTH